MTRLAKRAAEGIHECPLGTALSSSTSHPSDGSEDFGDFMRRSAHEPIHRNRQRLVRDDRTEPGNRPGPAIRQSRRGHDQPVKVQIQAQSLLAPMPDANTQVRALPGPNRLNQRPPR